MMRITFDRRWADAAWRRRRHSPGIVRSRIDGA